MADELRQSTRLQRHRSLLVVGYVATALVLLSCGPFLVSHAREGEPTWNDLRRDARRAGFELTVPEWEPEADTLRAVILRTVETTERNFEKLWHRTRAREALGETLTALATLDARLTAVYNRCFLIKELSPNPAMRASAASGIGDLQAVRERVAGDPDLLQVLQQVHSQEEAPTDEQRRLIEQFIQDALRAGAHLPEPARLQLQAGWRRLRELCTTYDADLQRAEGFLSLSQAELNGVPPRFLEFPGMRTGPDEFRIQIHQDWQFHVIMEHAALEDTRRRALVARHALAPGNRSLLERVLRLRQRQAHRLAARSWAHLQAEQSMVSDPQTALDWLVARTDDLARPFDQELQQLQALKAQLTRDPEATVHLWDWRYLRMQQLTRELGFDPAAYRRFFPLTRTLESLFGLSEQVFGVALAQVDRPPAWAPGVVLTLAKDTDTDRPLGLLYLDLFEREGKTSRFAQFDLTPAHRLTNGRYQCPVIVLSASFPRPSATQAVGLTPAEVQSVYHEFGHALHALLVETDYARLWRERGPRDYAEVPALVLEHWARDPRTLKSWAVDVQEPGRAVPDEMLHRLQAARRAARHVARQEQLAYALLDLELHRAHSRSLNPVEVAAQVFMRTFLPLPAATGSTFPATLDHLTGYDARYYSYPLAETVATQRVAPFHRSPLGLLDPELGRQLRDEIFSVGGRHPVPSMLESRVGR
jgi:Zn-dependent oligopeptidase